MTTRACRPGRLGKRAVSGSGGPEKAIRHRPVAGADMADTTQFPLKLPARRARRLGAKGRRSRQANVLTTLVLMTGITSAIPYGFSALAQLKWRGSTRVLVMQMPQPHFRTTTRKRGDQHAVRRALRSREAAQGDGAPAGPGAHPADPVQRRGTAVRRRALGRPGPGRARHVLPGDARPRRRGLRGRAAAGRGAGQARGQGLGLRPHPERARGRHRRRRAGPRVGRIGGPGAWWRSS